MMKMDVSKPVRIAILDMYEGFENQGMRCLREIINHFAKVHQLEIQLDEFEVRLNKKTPDLSYNIYISSGGPGSPLESEGNEWEQEYFHWLSSMEEWNKSASQKKYAFFICHSFQLVVRHWKLANVCQRNSTAFGVFPVHLLDAGKHEPVFKGLRDPFYAVDSRDWQVIEPRMDGNDPAIKILCIEKERPHVPWERAVMAMRFNEYFFGTQFHPEADATGMSIYLQTEEKKKTVIENHGYEKWQSMLTQLNDPDKILWTYSHILPNFLSLAVESMQEATV